jgi:hypothetical protein
MAVQIQLRNDTAANWTAANPVLAAGELGVETNTGKMKIGTGSTAWSSLTYFQPAAQEIISQIVDSAPLTLDTLNELAAALNDDPSFATTITNALAAKAPLASPNFTGTATLPSTTSIGSVSSTEIGYLDGVTSAIQTQLDGKSATAHTHVISNVTNLQTSLDAKAPLTQPIEAKTGAYTLAAADKGDLVTGSGTFTITVPGNVFAAGDRVDFINIGSGTITFSGSSLTLNSVDAKFTVNKQWAGATIFFTSATTAVLIGNLA